MTDAEYVFKKTVKERSDVKRSAVHKKNGSKSKKCKTPSDYLTKKEREKMNGPVVSLKMNKPMTNWKEFRSLPEGLQREYIIGLITNYGARGNDIAQMMGVSKCQFYSACKAYNDPIFFKRGGQNAHGMDERFMDFLTAPPEKSEPVIVEKLVAVPPKERKAKVVEETKPADIVHPVLVKPVDEPKSVVIDIDTLKEVMEPAEEPKQPEPTYVSDDFAPIQSCSLSLSGKSFEILQVLSALLHAGTDYQVEVSFKKVS